LSISYCPVFGFGSSSKGDFFTLDDGFETIIHIPVSSKFRILFILFFLKCALVSNATCQWVQTNGPNMANITSFTVNGNDLFTEIWGEHVLLSTDNGQSWDERDSGLPYPIYVWNIFVVDSTTLLAGTGSNGIYRTIDYGRHWTPSTMDSGEFVSFTKLGSILFAASYGHGIFRSTDNGIEWTIADSGTTNLWATFLTGFHGYVFARNSGGLFRSSDTGKYWVLLDTGKITTIFPYDTVLFAGSHGNGIFRSTDDGMTWSRWETDSTILSVNGFATHENILFALTGQGVFRSLDQGQTWSVSNNGITDSYYTDIIAKDSVIFVGTQWGGIFRSVNNGTNWKSIAFPNSYVYALAMKGGDVYAGTDYVGFFRSGDEGNNWVRSNTGFPFTDYIGGFFVRDSTLLAGLYDGVYRSTDNGSTWSPPIPTIDYSVFHCFTAHGSYIFSGSDIRGVFRSSDDGIHWQASNSGLPDTIIKSMATVGDDIFAGTNTGVFVSHDDGLIWTRASDGLPAGYVLALSAIDTVLFAATNGWGIYRSSDHGENWNPVNTGLTDGYVLSLTATGSDLFAGTLTLYHFVDTSYIPGHSGVFLSRDLGTHWVEVDDGLPINDVYALTTTKKAIYAGTMGHGVWRRPLSDFGINSVEQTGTSYHTITLYPNPTSGICTLHHVPSDRMLIEVTNILGETVISFMAQGGADFTIDLSEQPAGVYYVRLVGSTAASTLMVIRE
jgi:photosystem II stability/assembly factor-like uncharacterized protein